MAEHAQGEGRPLLVEMPIEVKTYDIDYFNHVNNAVYMRWLEDMRLRFLQSHFPLQDQFEQGLVPIMTSIEIHYKRGISLFDQPTGHIWLADLSNAIFTLGAEIAVDGAVTTVATQCGIFADVNTMKPLRIPAELRLRWEEIRATP
jgi:acyl-CoA thioester hydrolase